jgi:MFS transporter, DHA1 family, tetracycline resistance protein
VSWVMRLVSALVTFATGVIRPAATSLITQLTARSEQGSVLGLTQSLQSLASIVAPFVAGVLIDYGQLAAWAIVPAVVCAAGSFIRRPPEIPESHLAGHR